MQLVRKENIDAHTQLGIGLADDVHPELLKQHPKGKKFQKNKNQQRQQQCAASIALLQSLLGRSTVELEYNKYGKPILLNSDKAVSISHSKDYVGVLVGEARALGCDIEVPHARIKKIAPRFMHPEEWRTVHAKTEIIQLTAYWSAKEALYKLYGKKGLRFKENIRITPFEIGASSCLTGTIIKNSVQEVFRLHCQISDKLVACCVGSDKPI